MFVIIFGGKLFFAENKCFDVLLFMYCWSFVKEKVKQRLSIPWGWIFASSNYSHSSSTLLSKNNGISLKNKCFCNHEIIWWIIMKMNMKMKNRSHRYNINRPVSRHGHKYIKYKKRLSMMMLTCVRQRLSNIWSSVHEKVKQHWGWVEEKRYSGSSKWMSCVQTG